MGWRNYLQTPDTADANKQYISDWKNLTAEEYYKIESYLVKGSGHDYLSVAVEFEKSNTEAHHHTNREVQMLDISIDNFFKEFEIIINHPPNSADNGFWYPCFTTLSHGAYQAFKLEARYFNYLNIKISFNIFSILTLFIC